MLFQVKTVTANGQYAPRHVLAIWITNENDQYITSLKVRAATYKSKLNKWKTFSGELSQRMPSVVHHSHRTKHMLLLGMGKMLQEQSCLMEITKYMLNLMNLIILQEIRLHRLLLPKD